MRGRPKHLRRFGHTARLGIGGRRRRCDLQCIADPFGRPRAQGRLAEHLPPGGLGLPGLLAHPKERVHIAQRAVDTQAEDMGNLADELEGVLLAACASLRVAKRRAEAPAVEIDREDAVALDLEPPKGIVGQEELQLGHQVLLLGFGPHLVGGAEVAPGVDADVLHVGAGPKAHGRHALGAEGRIAARHALPRPLVERAPRTGVRVPGQAGHDLGGHRPHLHNQGASAHVVGEVVLQAIRQAQALAAPREGQPHLKLGGAGRGGRHLAKR